jgi:hypothetical protein
MVQFGITVFKEEGGISVYLSLVLLHERMEKVSPPFEGATLYTQIYEFWSVNNYNVMLI